MIIFVKEANVGWRHQKTPLSADFYKGKKRIYDVINRQRLNHVTVVVALHHHELSVRLTQAVENTIEVKVHDLLSGGKRIGYVECDNPNIPHWNHRDFESFFAGEYDKLKRIAGEEELCTNADEEEDV